MSITVEQLEARAKEVSEAREEQARIKVEYQRASDQVEMLESALMSMLEEAQIASYKSKVGTFTIVNRESVKFPQDLDKRLAFVNWAKEQGVYDQLFTVASQTLNSLYKKEKLASEERGELFFELPGIDRGTVSPHLSFRKA